MDNLVEQKYIKRLVCPNCSSDLCIQENGITYLYYLCKFCPIIFEIYYSHNCIQIVEKNYMINYSNQSKQINIYSILKPYSAFKLILSKYVGEGYDHFMIYDFFKNKFIDNICFI